MFNVDVYKNNGWMPQAKIRPLKMKRNWFSNTAYNCTPIAMASILGYELYYDHDISFIWDGDMDIGAEGIIGKESIWKGRGEGSVSFLTNLIFKTDENTSILTMPVPNQTIEGASVISTLLSTSFFTGMFPVAWKIDHVNKEYFIPAGTAICCILPISVGQINNSSINIYDEMPPYDLYHEDPVYLKTIKEHQQQNFLQLYKKGIDHNGNKVGNHEVDHITLNVNYIEKNKI